jgi:hypothetical protein
MAAKELDPKRGAKNKSLRTSRHDAYKDKWRDHEFPDTEFAELGRLLDAKETRRTKRSTGAAGDAGFEIIVFWRRPRYRHRYPTSVPSNCSNRS